jgi:sulfur carrier protein
MNIKMNGEARSVPDGSTVQFLLAELALEPQSVVVERNGDILARDAFGDCILVEGDALDVLRFVGGG